MTAENPEDEHRPDSPSAPRRLRSPKALVFDLDGTLVDSREDIANALNEVLLDRGYPALPLAEVLPLVGDGARALVERGLMRAKRTAAPPAAATVDDAVATFVQLYAERPCERTRLLHFALEALALAPSAVVTNKPRTITDLVLASLGITERVLAVYGGGDGPLKPAPDGVLAVLASMGVAPADAWMIGDGPQDVLAGRAAGCVTVGVVGIAEQDRLLGAGPDVVIEDLASLRELVAASRDVSVVSSPAS